MFLTVKFCFISNIDEFISILNNLLFQFTISPSKLMEFFAFVLNSD